MQKLVAKSLGALNVKALEIRAQKEDEERVYDRDIAHLEARILAVRVRMRKVAGKVAAKDEVAVKRWQWKCLGTTHRKI